MTRGFNNNKKFSFTLTAMIALVAMPVNGYGVAPPATELGPKLAPSVTKLGQVDLPCADADYYNQNPRTEKQGVKYNNCTTCKDTIKTLSSDMDKIVNGANAKNASIDAKGKADAAAKAAAAAKAGQDNKFTRTGDVNDGGKSFLTDKMNVAKGVGASAQQCVEKIEQDCKQLAQTDQGKADEAKKACEEAKSGAEQVAAEKGAGAGDLGQLMQQAGQLAQQLGQMMQPKPEEPKAAPSISETQTSSLSSKTPGASIGFDTASASKTAMVDKAAGSGGTGYTASGRDFSAEAANLSGSGFGSGISANSAGGSGATEASTGGGGGMNSSGASMMGEMPEKAAAAAKSEALGGMEWGGGGGGGGYKSPMFGLKNKNSDSGNELGDLLGDSKGVEGLEDGDRTLASADEMGANDGISDAGDTLFNVIHNKLSEVKRRGSI